MQMFSAICTHILINTSKAKTGFRLIDCQLRNEIIVPNRDLINSIRTTRLASNAPLNKHDVIRLQ